MKSTRFFKILIALLVIINIATVMYFLWGKPKHMGPPTPIVEIIDFKPEIKSKIEKLEKEHHYKKRRLLDEARDLQEKLYLMNTSSEKEVKSNLDRLLQKEKEIHLMTVQFFHEINRQCSFEQQKKLYEIKKGAIHRTGKHNPPPNR